MEDYFKARSAARLVFWRRSPCWNVHLPHPSPGVNCGLLLLLHFINPPLFTWLMIFHSTPSTVWWIFLRHFGISFQSFSCKWHFSAEVHLAACACLLCWAELACSLDNLPPCLSWPPFAIPHEEMNYTVYCQSALIILASAKMTEHCSGPQTKEDTSKVQWTSDLSQWITLILNNVTLSCLSDRGRKGGLTGMAFAPSSLLLMRQQNTDRCSLTWGRFSFFSHMETGSLHRPVLFYGWLLHHVCTVFVFRWFYIQSLI